MNNLILSKLKRIDCRIKKKLNESQSFKEIPALTDTRGFMIGYIYHHSLMNNDVFQKDIEHDFKISRASISETLHNMEKDGYISFVSLPRDARYKKIILTELGLKIQEAVDKELNLIQNNMLAGFSDEKINLLLELLTKMEEQI